MGRVEKGAGFFDRMRLGLRDLRALGPGAPIRAAYEVSKRAGTHAIIFSRMPRNVPLDLISPFQPPVSIPDGARRRALDAASEVLTGRVQLFGLPIDVGPVPDWHHAIDRDARWPLDDWWNIDIRSDRRLADVKWAWELGRQHHVVLLARAVYLDPSTGAFAFALNTHLRTWIEQNPPEKGIHWYSNLEIAIRCIAWLQVLSLARGAIEDEVRQSIVGHIYHSGQHLLGDLPYTMSTMRNNHLLGDALGLIAIGRAFPENRAAARWARIGNWIFERQLRRHFRRDGSTIEDSISYHRFVLDMLALRTLVGDASPSTMNCLSAGAQFLIRMGALEGPIPQYGDWDGGRVLTTSGMIDDFRGIAWLGASLKSRTASTELPSDCDELVWYAPGGDFSESGEAERDGREVGGGIARASRGRFRVWLKAGVGPSHGHADLTSVSVLFDEGFLLGDPGTGTYNGSLEMRNYFRASDAHSVLRLDGADQLEPHRVFRWRHRARAKAGPPIQLGERVLMWGVHDAYRRLQPPTRVARLVVVSADSITVSDWIERSRTRPYTLSIPLPPAVTWRDGKLFYEDGSFVFLDLPSEPTVSCGSTEPYDGWWSDTYGRAVPATRLEVEGVLSTPVVWTIRRADRRPDEIELDVRWMADQIEVVAQGDLEMRSSMTW